MSKRKFAKGHIVKVIKGNPIGKIGEVIRITPWQVQYNGKTRTAYTVEFPDKSYGKGLYYSYELDYPSNDEFTKYTLEKAQMQEKQEWLPDESFNKVEFPTIDTPMFKVGDIVKVIMSKEVPNLGKIISILNNKRYEVEYPGGEKEIYFDYQLTKATPNDESFYYEWVELAKMANEFAPKFEKVDKALLESPDTQIFTKDKSSKEEPKYCKYCKELIDNEENFESPEPGVCDVCYDMRKEITPVKMRKSASIDMEHFDVFGKNGDWLEVTEWTNGEGIDIDIHYASDHDEDIRHFNLTYTQLSSIVNIVKKFGYEITVFTDSEEKDTIKI